LRVASVDSQTPAMPERARRSGCTACHAIDIRIVGPSWADVALMYRDDVENAKINLINKIQSGGKGNWNNLTKGVPMPPYSPRVSDEDIIEFVEFIFNIPDELSKAP